MTKRKNVTEKEMLEAQFNDGEIDLDKVFGSGKGSYKRMVERVKNYRAEQAGDKSTKGKKSPDNK